jgi:UDP-glucose 4-epimerase
MARIVIAGASGLTGLALTRRMCADHEVIAVARRAAPTGLSPNVKWLCADVSTSGWTSALPAQYDAVYALFQSPDFRDFPAKAADVFQTNVAGLQELLDHATRAACKRFVFTSTGGLYAPSPAPLGEDAPLTTAGPLSFYLTTKRCGELLVESYATQFSTLITRPFFIYGPGQAHGMLMARLIQSVREGKAIGLHGPNGLSINPIDVEDAARLLAAGLDAAVTGTLNLAGSKVISLRQIGEIIGKAVSKEPVFDVNINAVAPTVIADISAMSAKLGAPLVAPAEGLRRMIDAA